MVPWMIRRSKAGQLVTRAEVLLAEAEALLAKGAAAGPEEYPELDAVAIEVAREVGDVINARARTVKSRMPYKAQYILEEVIRHLQRAV